MTGLNSGSRFLDHPFQAVALIVGGGALGAAAGILAACLLTWHHIVSPDAVGIGFALGIGGVLAGCAAGLLAVVLLERKH